MNAPTVASGALRSLAPYTLLAEKLGSFLAQRIGAPVRKIELLVSGDVVQHGTEHLRLAFLVGLLKHSLETGVNIVNAPKLAKERGILVLESQNQEAAYQQGEIHVRASERGGTRSHFVSGAVFGRAPRITRVDEVRLDLPPEGHLMLTRHRDVPGVLGRIGTQLGEQQVNIQRLELSPPEVGANKDGSKGLAFGFLTLQAAPSDEVLAAIGELDEIEEVSYLHL